MEDSEFICSCSSPIIQNAWKLAKMSKGLFWQENNFTEHFGINLWEFIVYLQCVENNYT